MEGVFTLFISERGLIRKGLNRGNTVVIVKKNVNSSISVTRKIFYYLIT